MMRLKLLLYFNSSTLSRDLFSILVRKCGASKPIFWRCLHLILYNLYGHQNVTTTTKDYHEGFCQIYYVKMSCNTYCLDKFLFSFSLSSLSCFLPNDSKISKYDTYLWRKSFKINIKHRHHRFLRTPFFLNLFLSFKMRPDIHILFYFTDSCKILDKTFLEA